MMLAKRAIPALLFLPSAFGSESAEYSYDPFSVEGPAHWKDIVFDDGTVNECGGQYNSPIDVQVLPECTWYTNYEFIDGDCAVKDFGFEISPHAEQINAPGPESCNTSTMRVPFYDYTFEMKQFHIHVSSEHTLNGKHFGAELHVVHSAREADDVFAVLAFFIEPTAIVSHPIFDQILRELDEKADEVANECFMPPLTHWWQSQRPDIKSDIHRHNQTLNIYDLIPEGASFYNYDGGLTTPPCTEAVVWNLVDMPIQITPAQYTELVALIVNHIDELSCGYSTIADPHSGSTSRPTQPLNGRRVERFCPDLVVLQAQEVQDTVVEAAEERIDEEETASQTGSNNKQKDNDQGVEVSRGGNKGGRHLYQFRGGRR